MEGSRLMETFSTLAPRLWALGWRGLVPLRPNEKTPAIQRWQTYNQGQTEDELKELVEARVGNRAGSGVGVCSGNGVLFLDLDIEIQKALIRQSTAPLTTACQESSRPHVRGDAVSPESNLEVRSCWKCSW